MSTISSFLIIFWPPESGYLVPRIHHPSRYYDIRKHRVDKVAWPSHFFFGGGVSDPLCLSSSSALHFFRLFFFGSITLFTRMTGNSLHMQWPLTSQSHGSVSQREQLVFCYGSNSTPLSDKESPRPALTPVHGMEYCENWPGRGLNPGLPNDTPVLYPLLHKLMLAWQSLLTGGLVS
jgi:hypothetical protein